MPVVQMAGEVDLSNASGLFAELAGSSDRLVLDLSRVTFLDSSGLVQIVRLARDHDLRVVAPFGSQPRSVLQVSGLHGAIATFDTVEGARELPTRHA